MRQTDRHGQPANRVGEKGKARSPDTHLDECCVDEVFFVGDDADGLYFELRQGAAQSGAVAVVTLRAPPRKHLLLLLQRGGQAGLQ